MINRRIAVIAVFSGLVALSGAAMGLGPANAQIHLNMANEYPAGSLPGQGDAEFAKRVLEATDGRVEISNQFGGSSGMKSADHFSAVEDGAVAIASTPTDKMLGIAPIFGLFSIPFLMPTIPDAQKLVSLARSDLEEVFDEANQVLLFTSPWTPSGIWANVAITDVATLQELKLRTYDAISTVTMSNAGVNAVQLTWGDVFPGLSTGMINSVLTSDEGGVSSKIWEHTSVFNSAGFGIGINTIHMNKDQFARLSAEDQEVVREVAREVEEWAWQLGVDRQTTNFEIMRENGVEIVEPMPDAVLQHLRDAAAPIRSEWEEAFGEEKAKAILDPYLN